MSGGVHHAGPLYIGGKQVTGNDTISELDSGDVLSDVIEKVNEIIAALVDAGILTDEGGD